MQNQLKRAIYYINPRGIEVKMTHTCCWWKLDVSEGLLKVTMLCSAPETVAICHETVDGKLVVHIGGTASSEPAPGVVCTSRVPPVAFSPGCLHQPTCCTPAVRCSSLLVVDIICSGKLKLTLARIVSITIEPCANFRFQPFSTIYIQGLYPIKASEMLVAPRISECFGLL